MSKLLAKLLLVGWLGLSIVSVPAQDSALQAVKDAIRKAETGRPGSLNKDKVLYADAHLQPILAAIEKCFAPTSAQVLNAKLDFKVQYYEGSEYKKVIRKENPNAKYKPIGGAVEYVEVEGKNKSKHAQTYVISGGDVEVLRGAEAACLTLDLALKDTQLDSKEARRQCPALKSLHSLLQYLPKYANQYLNVEGVAAARYETRLAQVDKLRAEVLAIHKEWLAEMGKLPKPSK